jgi:hypothetical protein
MQYPDWKCSPRKSSAIKKRSGPPTEKLPQPTATGKYVPSANTMGQAMRCNNLVNNNPHGDLQDHGAIGDPIAGQTTADMMENLSQTTRAAGPFSNSDELFDQWDAEVNPYDIDFANSLPFLAEDSFTTDSFGPLGEKNSLGYATDPFRVLNDEFASYDFGIYKDGGVPTP